MHSGRSFWTNLVAIFTSKISRHMVCCCNFIVWACDKMGGGGGGLKPPCPLFLRPCIAIFVCEAHTKFLQPCPFGVNDNVRPEFLGGN